MTLTSPEGRDETITTTTEHPFWVADVGFVPAGDLRVGQSVARWQVKAPLLAASTKTDVTSGALLIKSLTIQASGVRPWLAHNLTVEGDHTFFVGESDAWVHNICLAPQVAKMENAGEDVFLGTFNQVKVANRGAFETGTTQSGHLNQTAAFKAFPELADAGQGTTTLQSITLKSSTSVEGSQHWKFHDALERFWGPYRQGGSLADIKPTIVQYNSAVEASLKSAGFSDAVVAKAAAKMKAEQAAYGLSGTREFKDVPAWTPIKGKSAQESIR